MELNKIEQYIEDFQARAFPVTIPRKLPKFYPKKINAIIGPRRAGKTTLLFQIMDGLLKSGKSREEILYLNFEDINLVGMQAKDILSAVEIHKKKFSHKPILFLDEPQNVPSWEKAVRTLYDEDCTIYISGSSSKMLSKEIHTSLRGRSLSYVILPFSFKEYVAYKSPNNKAKTTDEKIEIKRLLDEYLTWGGFPEIVLGEDETFRKKTLENYFELVVYKDIIERHNLKDTGLVKWVLNAVASNYAKEFSTNKVYLTIKSQRSVSNNDVYAIVSMANDAFFSFSVPRFTWSYRKREVKAKTYLSDIGFAQLFTEKSVGRRMENVVFLELLNNLEPFEHISFWKEQQTDYEVDFLLSDRGSVMQLIQVCSMLDNKETKEREVRALLKAGRELKCKELIIITSEKESEEQDEWFGIKGKIKYIPLWKWLLEK